jgi:hypothetical protein
MSHWVMVLLATAVALGTSRMSAAKAMQIMLLVTTVVVCLVVVRT